MFSRLVCKKPTLYSRCVFFVIISLISLVANTVNAGENAKTTQPVAASTGEWVVVLKDPRPARLKGFQIKGYNTHYNKSLELKRFGKRVVKQHKLTLKDAWFIDSLGVYCLIVKFDGDTNSTLSALNNDERVSWVQKSNDFELLSAANMPNSPTLTTEVLADANQLDGRGVRIAIIDSGVASRIPDFGNAIKLNQDLVFGGTPANNTGEKHGTAMAGIIVAKPNNSLGLPGVAPAAEILAYRGCWEGQSGNTQCNTLSLARALDKVLKARPSILNLSLSGPSDKLLDGLIDVLVAQNTFVVAAFDPKRPVADRFPMRRSGVLIVRAEHMNQNYQDEFTAPGKRIVVSPDSDYITMSGHSVATAYTSGLLALITQAAENTEEFDLYDLVDEKGKPKLTNALQIISLKNDLARKQTIGG